MSSSRREIFVYAEWKGMDSPLLMGSLFAEKSRGKEIFSFEYSHEWLHSKHSGILDPDLRLFPGAQYLSDDKPNYGLFLDSSPDRWGRLLMRRREAA